MAFLLVREGQAMAAVWGWVGGWVGGWLKGRRRVDFLPVGGRLLGAFGGGGGAAMLPVSVFLLLLPASYIRPVFVCGGWWMG